MVDSNEEQLCCAREIYDNVSVGNCIIKPYNNLAAISVLNSFENDIKITKIDLKLVPLSEYSILNFHENNENQIDLDRVQRIIEKTNFNDMNDEESEALKQIIYEYKELFYLEGDALTHTNCTR